MEQNDYQPSQPILCANNCGFFGNASTMNLCSKCHREVRNREEQAASAKSAMERSLNPNPNPNPQMEDSVPVPEIGGSIEASSAVGSEAASRVGIEAVANRCRCCNKRLGLMGFKCRCGVRFCGTHRYPEDHGCEFDFKAAGKSAIARANPVVKGEKLERF